MSAVLKSQAARDVVLVTGADLADKAVGMLSSYELVYAGKTPTEDDLVALCERHGLRLLLTPFDTFFTWVMWEDHPYNAERGGPCRSRLDLLTDPEGMVAVKRRIAFAVERAAGIASEDAFDHHQHPAPQGSARARRIEDLLDGGTGNDRLWPGRGADKQYGGDGDDVLHSLARDKQVDTIDCGPGNDVLDRRLLDQCHARAKRSVMPAM